MLIPYGNAEILGCVHKSAYNFYLSQLRIRIEIAFGLLTTKWRIFRRNLDFSTQKNCKIVRVAAKLHNFVINMEKKGVLRDETILSEDFVEPLCTNEYGCDENGVAHGQRGYLDTRPEEADDGENWDLSYHDIFDPLRQNYIHNDCVENDLKRPLNNVVRNGVQ